MIKEIISNFASDEEADELEILVWQDSPTSTKKLIQDEELNKDRSDSSILTRSSRD